MGVGAANRRRSGGLAGVAVRADVLLEGAFDGRGWQGATLLGCLRGVTLAEAQFRPGPGRKCIWEQVLHAAYWKYAVIGLLDWRYGEGMEFGRSPANWPAMSGSGGEAAWRADVALLRRMHTALVEVVSGMDPGSMGEVPESRPGRKRRQCTRAQYLAGIVAHDAYHCGQVQLLKRLARGG